MWTDEDINGKEFKLLEGQTKPRDIREKTKSGFGVTVFPSGKISFIYFYNFNGRKRRMTLGQYPKCTLDEARKRHGEALRVLQLENKDPALERKETKQRNKKSLTMTEKERFELLWLHYHSQIDENRAVHRSLEELRHQVKELQDELKSRTDCSHKSG